MHDLAERTCHKRNSPRAGIPCWATHSPRNIQAHRSLRGWRARRELPVSLQTVTTGNCLTGIDDVPEDHMGRTWSKGPLYEVSLGLASWLGPKLARRGLRKALNKVGDFWIAEVQSRVPVLSGDHPHDGGHRVGIYRQVGVITVPMNSQRIMTLLATGGEPKAASPANLWVYEYDWRPDTHGFIAIAAEGNPDNLCYRAKLMDISPNGDTRLKSPVEFRPPRVAAHVDLYTARLKIACREHAAHCVLKDLLLDGIEAVLLAQWIDERDLWRVGPDLRE